MRMTGMPPAHYGWVAHREPPTKVYTTRAEEQTEVGFVSTTGMKAEQVVNGSFTQRNKLYT